MKSKFVIIIFSAIIFCFASCGNRSANNHVHDHENSIEHNHNTHTHADGSVHSDHAPEQESFKVEADSSAVNHNH